MLTATRTTKAGAITRTIAVSFPLAGRYEARVTETQGNKTTEATYLLERIASDYGIAFQVRKIDGEGESYAVFLNQRYGGHSCECPWHNWKGHIKPCRHVEMALEIVNQKLL